jgi:hypothetical protein
MEPKLNLSGITIDGEDDHMGGYEFATNPCDTVTLSSLNYNNTVINSGYASPTYGAVPNIGITSPNVYTTSGSTGPFTFSAGTNTAPWFTQSPTSAKINLEGKDADIMVNGYSLVDAINNIQDRLNCLQINPELEKEWDELRALGDQYRELEKQILDKQATWDRLKAMPLPELD